MTYPSTAEDHYTEARKWLAEACDRFARSPRRGTGAALIAQTYIMLGDRVDTPGPGQGGGHGNPHGG